MSFTRGVSFHRETNASSQPTINNNISINASNEVKTSLESSEVRLNQAQSQSVEVSSIPNETEFLRKVLNIYMNQHFYVSGKYIVLTDEELLDLIQTLLPNKGIIIASENLEDVGCCSLKDVPIKKVESIWIDNEDDIRESFKYAYSNLVALLDQYKTLILQMYH